MRQGIYQGLKLGKAGARVLFTSVTICSAFGVSHLPGSGTSIGCIRCLRPGKVALSAVSRDFVHMNETSVHCFVLQSAPIFYKAVV